jgi:hypothetical protein
MSAYWAQWDSGDLDEMHGVCEDHDDEDYDIDFEVETEDERQEREDAEGQHFLYLDSFC